MSNLLSNFLTSSVTVPELLLLISGTLTSYPLHCLGSLAAVIFLSLDSLCFSPNYCRNSPSQQFQIESHSGSILPAFYQLFVKE